MLRTKVAIPVVALYTAWQAEGLPMLHNALLTNVDFDEDRLAEGDVGGLADMTRNAWADLERLGLARGGQVHADLARSLRLIAGAAVEFYAFFNVGDSDTRSALVAQSGDDALRVVLRPDKHFTVEPVRPEDAVQSLVAALPEAGPGRGGVLSLPADALADKPRHARSDDDGERSFLQASRPTGAHVAEAQGVRKLLAEPRTGGGQLFAARRDRYGRKHRCAAPLTFFDTVTGRYLSAKSTGGDGTPWLTVQPADFATIQGRLRQLSAEAAPRG
ncbi:ESX secretion-associated protein EspG [Saccharothrix obliqua]|uniref:ESX secretion-associated protein EspG n=1 Tax=Saccharothrix obliqua TaxID=2861747 RepID=UPI001C5E0B14|nr:ESX secretion-associated protein EspG [Saccharothrix obliqua]MBW4720747.1 ESX secretion-associated protein EspG [Saccharothrix obliqua]